ncbi:hypothetical protein [Umboniibacter marinipuniceus]|uniref:Uncharacterized protein n=1 Tax=Umboniibacter marinipuniceus TaxID=569599 RepID=A0A3M0A1A8_9GAMM|nr:hypothetical protein [Umboniibacter marinipuniceus]RMA78396.1 hypothetical protein DFR27_2327 [Umboniibacter marinipuniceus]
MLASAKRYDERGASPRRSAYLAQRGTSLIEALLLVLLTALVLASQQQLLAHASATFQLAEARRFVTSAERYLIRPQHRHLNCDVSSACDWPWPLPRSLQTTGLSASPVCWQYGLEQACLERRQ